ncbi:hypothetical protein ALC57_04901 [Trachymyrmex cornetzi]|uniref:MADF domain-containing protein n=1 Tax=Trachymyrmex cornetzi TaxID=471704 RepID=A0A195EDE7_9HYME|nr:hypothetical protein ALC57_04901 [Trachymyrmex cornetzi]
MREEYDNNLSEPGTSTCQLTNNKDDEQQEDIDELLITCVARKRALFDYRLPANERSNLKKKALWQEVCNLMGGVLSIDEAKRRWRYLRDCYMKAKKKEHEYTPSGSAADESLKKKSLFKFFLQMQFLDDVQVKSV